ncbi:calcium-binding protein [Epibacterium ulvae]|uniref:calcium-binding protein n=1 Tax=Epibacterium ulvae TaxID=1156985 RepID=UPI0024906B3A|nr:calcium-binding protein [Epibacterium ulvae]
MPTSLQGLADPSLAYNLNGVVDYSPQMPFIDIMKMGRPFSGALDGGLPGSFTNEMLQDLGLLDQNGYPTEIPDGLGQLEVIYDWGATGDETYGISGISESRAGVYVLEWDGEGTLQLNGVNILSQENGRIIFENPNGTAFSLGITETDPNGTGDHIRDISIVREDHIELFEAGAIFNPEWTALINDSRQFRFMDWMDTNNSQITEFSQLNTMDDAFWNGPGMVPLEAMVRLSNELGVDPWFNMPLGASDEFIREFATYVRDNLDPGLVATFELSNETWNFLFDQTHTLSAIAEEDFGLTLYGYPDHHSAYGRAAVDMALILEDVFADTPDALHTTLGVFTGDPGTVDLILQAPSWQAADPENYIAPHSLFDSVAVTTYFGGSIVLEDTLREELIAQLDISYDTAASWLTERMRDPDFEGSVPQVLETLRLINDMADNYGVDVIIYEGGQHIHHLFGVEGDTSQLIDFFIQYVRSDDMASLYQQLWEGWAEFGDGPQMQFGDVAGVGDWGSWGLRSSLTDENPRAVLLDELNAETPAWWEDRGGEHFQHGVYLSGGAEDEQFTGTHAEDYLIASGGDDIIAGHGGNDWIHGGTGEQDEALFSGNRADYLIQYDVRNGFGGVFVQDLSDGSLRINEGTDWIVGVEFLSFADGTIDLISEFPELATTAPTPIIIPDTPDLPDPDTNPGDGTPDQDPDDPVSATSGDDYIHGTTGDDHIAGLAGNDLLIGDVGSDTLEGGLGNDLLIGDQDGNNDLAGDDIAVFSGSVSDYTYHTTVILDDAGLQQTLLNVTGATDETAANGTDILIGIERLQFDTGAIDTQSVITMIESGVEVSIGQNILFGTDAMEELDGTADADILSGLDGMDWLYGGAGADILLGGAGDDFIFGHQDNDRLLGGTGHDELQGGQGDDSLEGGSGNDVLIGDDGTNLNTGTDTAVFAGHMSDYSFEFRQLYKEEIDDFVSVVLVTDAEDGGQDGIDEGTDMLFNIDVLQFADQSIQTSDLNL